VIGAFVALHVRRGLAVEFIGWIAIHGVTELTATLLCGAAGLVLAEVVLFPGRHARLDNLALRGRSAAQIAVGAVILFFIAAVIEGGFRQLVASTGLRLTAGAATGALWLAYFLYAGRGRR
jgi:uncharacterized membrane protein SpoIIM required for sporulation